MKPDERKELQLELKARRELVKRLAYPLSQLEKADAKEQARREERSAALSEYKTQQEAHDAYGYDMITEDEYRQICETLEAGEKYVAETLTPINLALRILRKFVGRMDTEARDIEFELLPVEEQNRRREASEARRAEMEARKEARRP